MTDMTDHHESDAIIRALGLLPHPEGGYYAESWRDAGTGGQRGSGTAIYYLLKAGEVSAWHRVDAAEIWHFYAGAPLKLTVSDDGETVRDMVLGPDIRSGQRPQLIVPPHGWQMAQSTGTWTLVGCTVSPAFDFAGFELAPPGWAPGS
ncbi:MAG: cupin [Rhodospirillales bacterium]|nr:cupin [Rhodospirillales bacterium]